MTQAIAIGSHVLVRDGGSEWLRVNRDGRMGRVVETGAMVLVEFGYGDAAYFKPEDLAVR